MNISTQRLQGVQADIQQTVTKRGTQHIVNQNGEVTLLAVSKAQTAEKLREAHQAGQTKFGTSLRRSALKSENLNCAKCWSNTRCPTNSKS